MFQTYFQLGHEHILDLRGYDHMLFLVALCAGYRLKQWKEVLILVTAFTIGHSITLALAALRLVVLPSDIIEFLIPLTIFLTAMYNVLVNQRTERKIKFNYVFTLFFGLIHGLGFSNYFRALLGKEESISGPLLAFNLGVEFGQIIFVLIVLGVAFVILQLLRVRQRDWILFISGAAAALSIVLLVNAKFW